MSQTAFPASFAQQRLWFLDQLEPGTAAYNLPRAFRIVGSLDVDSLARAFQTVVQRHECLRTVFEAFDGKTSQIVLPEIEIPLPIVDLSQLPEQERIQTALRIAGEEGKKPFDLTHGPLLRTVLLRLAPDDHILSLVMHHIVTDGWSIAILFGEVTKCYEALAEGQSPDLPALPVQYGEYSQWQHDYLQGDVLAQEVGYWKKKLAGAQTILELPTDRRRPANHSWSGATQELIFDSDTLEKLKSFSRTQGATLFMTSMALFQAWLWRYTKQTSILVGTPTASRNHVEIEKLIGFFVNTLVFRADFTEELTFRELVRQIRGFALEAYAHQDIPFEKLVEELVPQRSMNITPLFQAMFVFQNIPKQIFKIAGLDMEELPFDSGIAKFDLSVDVYEDDEQHTFHWRFEYNTDLFDRSTIRVFLNHFRNMLTAAVENPDQSLGRIPMMTAQERAELIEGRNETAVDFDQPASIQAAFERQLKRSPEAVAVRSQGKALTYSALEQQANYVAHLLLESGVQPGDSVGVCLERSPEMIAALLGVLKCGAAYVPLDSTYPAEWLAFVLKDSEVRTVVTQSATRLKLPSDLPNVIVLDEDLSSFDGKSAQSTQPSSPADERAYVLYTSGSTGRPKGVEGTQRGCLNRLGWMWGEYPFAGGEVCCQKTNLGFVDSVWEIFGPLLAGVANVIIPAETLHDPELLLETLARERVTRIVVVPSLLRMLLDQAPRLGERVPKLRLWTCSGEVLPVELVERFRAGFPEARLLNLYGSAEVAADVTCHEVREEDCKATSIPIGKPISNTQIYILDEHEEPVPVGVRGEIYVGGAGLARGYWNRAELTAERFVGDGFAAGGSGRLFRTGDVGRYRGDGEIEYVGRLDNQVKLRGMRVELGEIEAVLRGHPQVEEGIVGVEGEGERQRLVGYVRLGKGKGEGGGVKAGELRRYMRSKLPEHMVPGSYREVEEWPLLPSGKVDRRAVARMGSVGLGEGESWTGPRTEVEGKLARIWEELLKVEPIGMEQNFFELGGHSLLALQVMARIRSQFEVELAVRHLFEGATIAALAGEVEKAQKLGLKARGPIVPRRARMEPASSAEALLAQLDNLSASELQSLLQRALQSKAPAD
jgi:amino acid adenylation domain-containing protein